jgi:Na+/H+ antiporter NhaD/arsenite permease-like protein
MKRRDYTDFVKVIDNGDMDLKRLLLNEWFFLSLLVAYAALLIYNPSFLNPNLIDIQTVLILAALIIANTGIFISGGTDFIASKILERFKDLKSVSIVAVMLTVLISMFITNDAALIVLVPMTVSIGRMAGKSTSRIVVLEAIGANVGSTLTPFGNPQNIILFRDYGLSIQSFFAGSIPLFLILLAVLLIFSLLLIKSSVITQQKKKVTYNVRLFYTSLILFITGIFGFLAGFDGYFFLGVSIVSILVLLLLKPKDYTIRNTLLRVDFFLIFTFVLIFLVINSVRSSISIEINGALSIFLLSALLSQLISNVPTTVLLTGKTAFVPLLWGVNIGGNGTMVASLANLIALRRSAAGRIWDFMRISGLFLLITLVIGALSVTYKYL